MFTGVAYADVLAFWLFQIVAVAKVLKLCVQYATDYTVVFTADKSRPKCI